jgi:RNA polymerase sigma-70 factor (ECF subfamily)
MSLVAVWPQPIERSRVASAAPLKVISAAPQARERAGRTTLADRETDEELMERYRSGDARAFDQLLRRHQRPLYNFVYRFVNHRATAEDVVQDAFLRIVRQAQSYKRESKFTTWLYTIARNLCVDHSRRMVHRRAASLDQPKRAGDEDKRTLGDAIPSQGPAVDRSAIGDELKVKIQAAIESLGDEQREVFLMREYAGLQFKEIADIVGIPENTAKSRMRYALEKLREDLREYEDLAEELG